MRENRMDENVTIVYTAYITLRNGHRLYAKQYGKKAFELHIRDNKHHKRKWFLRDLIVEGIGLASPSLFL
mgnify:CR=1 FL=1